MHKHAEDGGEHFGRDTNAVIADAHQEFISARLGAEPDMPATPSIFGRVVEQIGYYLRQAGQVPIHEKRFGRHRHGQFMAIGLNVRPAGFQRVVDDS